MNNAPGVPPVLNVTFVKNGRGRNSREPFARLAPPGDRPRSECCPEVATLPQQPVFTGLRGTHLVLVGQPGGGGSYWEAEVALNGERVHRRFASELHARAWLTQAVDPCFAPGTFDLEEINGSFRGVFFGKDR